MRTGEAFEGVKKELVAEEDPLSPRPKRLTFDSDTTVRMVEIVVETWKLTNERLAEAKQEAASASEIAFLMSTPLGKFKGHQLIMERRTRA